MQPAAVTRKFDLNIEKVLENWETYHAIREVIANALDEQILTKSPDVQIYEDAGPSWHIRDFGRGLRTDHLTQKENQEKLNNSRLVGKFGVGLKDALATFDRRGVDVLIRSRHGDITLGKAPKHDFGDIVTLHANVAAPSDPSFVGTDVVLTGCSATEIESAKNLFLKFSGERVLERTRYGDVLDKTRPGAPGRVYISGVRVAEEQNFLFSYNITSITQAMKKALNRERTNVGRTAYSERVKSILLACQEGEVAHLLVSDLREFQHGRLHDELLWNDVAIHACRLLNSREKVVFVAPDELQYQAGTVDHAVRDGYEIVVIPGIVRSALRDAVDIMGNPLRDMDHFLQDWNSSFEFRFVDPEILSAAEAVVWKQTDQILGLVGGKPRNVTGIFISETMRIDAHRGVDFAGLFEPGSGRIIIKRSELRALASFAGTLLHEVSHATSGATDVTAAFEDGLTSSLGKASQTALSRRG